MEVQISSVVGAQLKQASKSLGFKEAEIADRAILFYLDTLQKQIELKREFAEWDALSDEALDVFEKSL